MAGEVNLAKAIHSMVRVLDEARSVDFYQRAFNLSVADRLDFETFTLVYLSNPESEFELELTINKAKQTHISLVTDMGTLRSVLTTLRLSTNVLKTRA